MTETVKIALLRQKALAEVGEHARQLTVRKSDLGNDLSMRGTQLGAMRAKLVENGFDDTPESRDPLLAEIDKWLLWIGEAAAALVQLSDQPDTLA